MALLFQLLYITYCLWTLLQEAWVPPWPALVIPGQARALVRCCGRQAGSWYLFPLSLMSSVSSLWWFTCRGLGVHHVQGNFLDLRCWYKYNCLWKKMVLIRLWIPKHCLLDIICLDIYAWLVCCIENIVMLECGIFYRPPKINMLYIQFVLESRLIYLYIMYVCNLSYSLLAIIISYVVLNCLRSWVGFPLHGWVLFLGRQNCEIQSAYVWSAKCHWPQNKYLIRLKSRMESGCVQSKAGVSFLLNASPLYTAVNSEVIWHPLLGGNEHLVYGPTRLSRDWEDLLPSHKLIKLILEYSILK